MNQTNGSSMTFDFSPPFLSGERRSPTILRSRRTRWFILIEYAYPWKWLVSGTAVFLSIVVSVHAILRKRDPRAASWWVLVSMFIPFIGAMLYFLFGVNRIERKAIRLRRKEQSASGHPYESVSVPSSGNPAERRHLAQLAHTIDGIVKSRLVAGNTIVPLVNGEEAYPAMLDAIDGARTSVGLSTYIFEKDDIGRRFVDALGRAVRRGVKVRILIDSVGEGLSWNSIVPLLKSQNVPVASFLPTMIPGRMAYLNLRNHRKILTVDGQLAFTGGINISQSHITRYSSGIPCRDLHFKIEGPAVSKIQEVFRMDWHFTTGETLDEAEWFPSLEEKGPVVARAIADGPDNTIQKTRWAIMAALAHARERVQIMTPYFIPDASLITALQMASLNGAHIEILIPQKGDLRFVHWAMRAMLWQVLEHGCRVWETPPPFYHTKLMVVDGEWTLFGSTNWDVRSFRLNFEFNMECYDRELASKMSRYFSEQQKFGREITLSEIDARSIPTKIRDGFARLFMPIL